jgi:hypothetical protein
MKTTKPEVNMSEANWAERLLVTEEEKTSPDHERAEKFRALDAMLDAVRPRALSADRVAELLELVDRYGERVAIASLNDGELLELVASYRLGLED